MRSSKVRARFLAASAVLALGISPAVRADTSLSFNKFVQDVKISGDFRLRQDNIDSPTPTPDRQRQRMRMRLGMDFTLPDSLAFKSRLTTGEPLAADVRNGSDPRSGNQTLTNNGSKKGIFIDLAYLQWTPGNARFMAGKTINPFWTPESADVMWDPDYTPEGLTEGWSGVVGPVGLFGNAGQFSILERSADTQDAYDFSEQGGIDVRLPASMRLKTALAHHEFVNLAQGNGGLPVLLTGNTPGSNFSILEWTSALNLWVFNVPVSLQTTWLRNNAAKPTTVGGALSTAKKQDMAVQAGVVIGGTAARQFQVAGFYKEIDLDAVVAGITDDDFPNQNNAKGWIGWVSYSFNDFLSAKVKYFDSKKKVIPADTDPNETKRSQFDLVCKY